MDNIEIKPLKFDKVELLEKALKERFEPLLDQIQSILDEAGVSDNYLQLIRLNESNTNLIVPGFSEKLPQSLLEVYRNNYTEVHNGLAKKVG